MRLSLPKLNNILLALFALGALGSPCNCEEKKRQWVSPWNQYGGGQKVFIVTDPETGASLYIPANVFYERFGGGGGGTGNGSGRIRNPFVCDLFTRNCWLAGSRPTGQEQTDTEQGSERSPQNPNPEPTREPIRGGGGGSGGGGNHIFGHPNFHQGAFEGATTSRPFSPYNPNPITTQATERPIGGQSTVASRGGGGGAHIFGHPNFHQGNEDPATTARPFRPWSPNSDPNIDTRLNLGSSRARNDNQFRDQISLNAGGRTKRDLGNYASSSSSHSNGGGYQHQSYNQANFPAPDFGKMQEQFLKQAQGFGPGAAGFSGGFSSGFPGQNFQSGSYSPDATNYGGGGFASSQASNDIDPRINFGNSNSNYPTGFGAAYGGHNFNHQDYGNDMKHSTHTTSDGMVVTRMEGKKCDANGCRSSSSSSMHNPNNKPTTGYYNSGESSGYGSSNRAGTEKYYNSDTTTTRRPYTYSTTTKPYYYTTTTKPYTYSTTRSTYTTTKKSDYARS